MKELELIASDPEKAREIAAEKYGYQKEHLQVIEEYEPDEQDLKDYQEAEGLAEAPSQDSLSLFVLSISVDHYLTIAQSWTQGLIEKFAPGAVAEAIRFRHLIIIRLNVPESSILIGKQGATLDALQHIVVRALLAKDETFPDVMLDVERYREKKLLRLEKEAKRAAQKAHRSGRKIPLSPMSPAERKFIHNTLKDEEGVVTESRGKDRGRHVIIQSTNPRPQGRTGRRGGGAGGGRFDGNRAGNRGGGRGGNRDGNVDGNRRPGGANRQPSVTDDQRQQLYGNMKDEYSDEKLKPQESLLPKYFEDDEMVPKEPVSNTEDYEFEDELE